MSGENITILEGGKAENFGQVTKLKTSNGSGNDLWVPKTDVKTGHLSVKKNGLYYTNQYTPTASEKKDGKFYDIYGWDTITVSVKKKVTGKKRKGSKDVPISVEVDDDGNLIETEMVPTRIEIETPPEQLSYFDGEQIYLDGIVVKAYTEDDQEWGTVPFDELTPKPTKAEYTQSDLGFTADEDWLVNDAGTYLGRVIDRSFYKSYDGKAIAAFKVYTVGGDFTAPILLALDGKSVEHSQGSGLAKVEVDGYSWYVNARYGYAESNNYDSAGLHVIPSSTLESLVNLVLSASNAHAYGGETGKQTIHVNWDRGDGEILTDSFEITVNPAP